MKKSTLLFLTSLCLLSFTRIAQAQEAPDAYPSKVITFVVPYAAGGSSDTRARQVAQKVATYLGKPIIIENKPGAGANIGTEYIAKAKPDGYTIGMGNFAPLSVNKALFPKLNYEPSDLMPVVLIERGPVGLVVRTQSTYKNVKDLIADAKAKPGRLSFASSGTGSSYHLAGELFKDRTGTFITHIPYRGGAPATNDLLGGNVDMMFELLSASSNYIKGANPRERVLALASNKRNPIAPDVPTFAELGFKDMEISNWFGVVAPKGTPPGIIAKLNAAYNRALKEPDIIERITSSGNEIGGGTPQDFDKFIKAETVRWTKLIKSKNIQPE